MRPSIDAPTMITTSTGSPRFNRLGMASGESPSDGPRMVTSFWPEAFSNAGEISWYAW